MTRLDYETQGGHLSVNTTYDQLIMHLRKAAEASYALGHYHKEQDDQNRGTGFLACGQVLEQIVKNVTSLAVRRRN